MRRTRHQLLQHIDADYYGFRDEEDGVLEKVEAQAEALLREQVLAATPACACLDPVLRGICRWCR